MARTRTSDPVGLAPQQTADSLNRAEAASRVTEERFELLVSRVKDYAIFMLDPDGNVVSWNEGAARIKGYTEDEIIGRNITLFYTPDDQRRDHARELLERAEREGRVEEEGWRVRKDGTRFWADVLITALRDSEGRLRGFGKVTRDLTERREAEIALSELSGRLMQVQDDERRHLARELHDATSPLITGLITKLYAARQKLKSERDDPVAGLIDDALTNAEATGTVVRTVAGMLHPPLLDERGLVASLQWYLNAYAKRTEIKLDTRFPETMARLPRDAEIALFRVAQEAVAHVLRLAGAKRISIALEVNGECLELTMQGVGPGLALAALRDVRAGRGEAGIVLAGMKERMRQLGGNLHVEVDGTTLVRASLDLKQFRRL